MAWLLVADRPVSARSDSRASTADWSARLFKGALLAFVAALMSVLVVRSAKLPTSESAQRSELIYATTFGSRVSNFPHIATGRVPNTCYPGPVLLCTAERPAEELDTYSNNPFGPSAPQRKTGGLGAGRQGRRQKGEPR